MMRKRQRKKRDIDTDAELQETQTVENEEPCDDR